MFEKDIVPILMKTLIFNILCLDKPMCAFGLHAASASIITFELKYIYLMNTLSAYTMQ